MKMMKKILGGIAFAIATTPAAWGAAASDVNIYLEAIKKNIGELKPGSDIKAQCVELDELAKAAGKISMAEADAVKAQQKIFIDTAMGVLKKEVKSENPTIAVRAGELPNLDTLKLSDFANYAFANLRWYYYETGKTDKYPGIFIPEKQLQTLMTNFNNLMKKELKKCYNKSYIQKLVPELGNNIVIFGDIHGDFLSLLKLLLELKKMKFIDDDWAVQSINGKPTQIVFLGDYEERGAYDIEVWSTIMNLKLKNPQQVVLIRGNHETFRPSADCGLSCKKRLEELYKNIDSNSINSLFELLPQALYVHNKDANEIILLCHGGYPYPSKNALLKIDDPEETVYKDVKKLITEPAIYALAEQDIQYYWNDIQTGGKRGIGSRVPKESLDNRPKKDLTISPIIKAHQHNVTIKSAGYLKPDGTWDNLELEKQFPINISPAFNIISCPAGLGRKNGGFYIVTIGNPSIITAYNYELAVLQENTMKIDVLPKKTNYSLTSYWASRMSPVVAIDISNALENFGAKFTRKLEILKTNIGKDAAEKKRKEVLKQVQDEEELKNREFEQLPQIKEFMENLSKIKPGSEAVTIPDNVIEQQKKDSSWLKNYKYTDAEALQPFWKLVQQIDEIQKKLNEIWPEDEKLKQFDWRNQLYLSLIAFNDFYKEYLLTTA